MQFASIFVTIFYAYIFLGFLFGLWFVFRGVHKVDEGMVGTKINLRLLLLPGTVALWPIMLRKYFKA